MSDTPRIVQGSILTSINSLFLSAKPLVDIVDSRFQALLEAEGIESPNSKEASEFFMAQDMDAFYSKVVTDNPELAGVLLEACALILGSVTVSRAFPEAE